MKRFFEIIVPRDECVKILNKVGDYLVSVTAVTTSNIYGSIDSAYIIVGAENIDGLNKLIHNLYGNIIPIDLDFTVDPNHKFASDLWESDVADIYPSNGCFYLLANRVPA